MWLPRIAFFSWCLTMPPLAIFLLFAHIPAGLIACAVIGFFTHHLWKCYKLESLYQKNYQAYLDYCEKHGNEMEYDEFLDPLNILKNPLHPFHDRYDYRSSHDFNDPMNPTNAFLHNSPYNQFNDPNQNDTYSNSHHH